MMKTLFDSFTELKTSYYGIGIDAKIRFSGNNSTASKKDVDKMDAEKCREFIAEHFDQGGKCEALNFDFYKDIYANNDNKNAFRHIHMVALYLLGLSLEDIFAAKLKTKLSHIMTWSDEWYNFKYTWYLTCLYHDTASFIEKGFTGTEPENQKNLAFWLERANVCHTPYTHETMKENVELMRHSEDLVKNYFYYRANCKEKDHGIYGGYLLFDLLKKNFLEKTEGKLAGIKQEWAQDYSPYLHWRREHLDHFAYVADAIICHNMWTVQSDDEDAARLYRRYRLDELIVSNNNDKLSMDEYPLQFMLCLLDTIEPVKRLRKLTAREVLENISIEVVGNNRIKIAWNDVIKQEPNFWDWMKGISNMKNWMQVNVSPCRQEGNWCYVTIDIR